MTNDDLTPEMQTLLADGQAAMAEENWVQAVAIWSELYTQLPTFEVNMRLVTALQFDQQYRLALEIAKDYLSDYLVDTVHQKQLISLAIMNQQFVYAQELTMWVTDQSDRQLFLQEIRRAEEQAQTTLATTFQTTARQFYHLSDYDLASQQQRYQEAYILPVDQFVAGARYLLLDPYSLPIMRASLLEDLKKLGVADTIHYRWIDGSEYDADLPQVTLPLQSNQYQTMRTHLIETLGQEDPVALTALQDQLRLEVSLLFPRIAQSLITPIAWVQTMVASYYQKADQGEPISQAKLHRQVDDVLASLL